MKTIVHWLVGEWLGLAAFIVAALSFRSSRPRIKVNAEAGVEIDPEQSSARGVVRVTVINDGGSAATVRMVHLVSVSGRFGVYPSKTTRGPDLSTGHVELAP